MIPPGATIGLLGGGQLGRMTALAARDMGYDVRVLDPDPDPPAAALSSNFVRAAFDDVEAAVYLARQVRVVTFEIERVAIECLEAAARYVPVRPGPAVLAVVQNRERQKAWLVAKRFPVGPYRAVKSVVECEAAVAEFGASYVKASTGGYDGRGQVRVASVAECDEAWRALRAERCVVEQALVLEREISVMVARRENGERVAYPPALNHHEDGQLAWSVIPAPIPDALAQEATALGIAIAESLGVVGLVAVEMFVTGDGTLLVNELAPRPHNSFHHTIEACVTSQFEQLVRTVCDLPLGATDILRPAAIANILGDAWRIDAYPNFAGALAVPGTRLHLYGKRDPRPARKMGHLAAVGESPEEALARVREAAAALSPGVRPVGASRLLTGDP